MRPASEPDPTPALHQRQGGEPDQSAARRGSAPSPPTSARGSAIRDLPARRSPSHSRPGLAPTAPACARSPPVRRRALVPADQRSPPRIVKCPSPPSAMAPALSTAGSSARLLRDRHSPPVARGGPWICHELLASVLIQRPSRTAQDGALHGSSVASGGGGIRTLVGPKWPETVFETCAWSCRPCAAWNPPPSCA